MDVNIHMDLCGHYIIMKIYKPSKLRVLDFMIADYVLCVIL